MKVIPVVLHSCLLSKVYSGMTRLTLPDRVCSQTAIMACHTQRRLAVYIVQGI